MAWGFKVSEKTARNRTSDTRLPDTNSMLDPRGSKLEAGKGASIEDRASRIEDRASSINSIISS